MYVEKKIIFALAFLCLLCYGAGYYTCLTRHNTAGTDSNNVSRTVQQLETNYEATQRELQEAGERNKDATDTAQRIQELYSGSQQLLDKLQTELDGIARANGLDDSRKKDNGTTT